jgi:hypothetical protein
VEYCLEINAKFKEITIPGAISLSVSNYASRYFPGLNFISYKPYSFYGFPPRI